LTVGERNNGGRRQRSLRLRRKKNFEAPAALLTSLGSRLNTVMKNWEIEKVNNLYAEIDKLKADNVKLMEQCCASDMVARLTSIEAKIDKLLGESAEDVIDQE